MDGLSQNKFSYGLFALCFILSSLILFILPQSYKISFNLKVSQINVDAPDSKQVAKLQKLILPQNSLCAETATANLYYCIHETKLKSEQDQAYEKLQKNKNHGFLTQSGFSRLLERKVKQIQELRKDSVSLELKLIDLDEKLSEEDQSIASDWQSQNEALQSELEFNQQRLKFFETSALSNSKTDKPELYQSKIEDIKNSIDKLKQDIEAANTQKKSFSNLQNSYIDVQEQLNKNNEERETLIRRTGFLEQINKDYSDSRYIPDPDKIQFNIQKLRLTTQRYHPAKLFYVIPLSFLLLGLCLFSKQSFLHYNNRYNLSTDDIAQELNASFLGDLNSFFSENSDKTSNND